MIITWNGYNIIEIIENISTKFKVTTEEPDHPEYPEYPGENLNNLLVITETFSDGSKKIDKIPLNIRLFIDDDGNYQNIGYPDNNLRKEIHKMNGKTVIKWNGNNIDEIVENISAKFDVGIGYKDTSLIISDSFYKSNKLDVISLYMHLSIDEDGNYRNIGYSDDIKIKQKDEIIEDVKNIIIHPNFKFGFNSMLRDKIAGFEGVVVARCSWLYSMNTYALAVRNLKDEIPIEKQYFDECDLEALPDDPKMKEIHVNFTNVNKFNLGDIVKHDYLGIEGKILCIVEWRTSCITYGILPIVLDKDGNRKDIQYQYQNELVLLQKTEDLNEDEQTGGPITKFPQLNR